MRRPGEGLHHVVGDQQYADRHRNRGAGSHHRCAIPSEQAEAQKQDRDVQADEGQITRKVLCQRIRHTAGIDARPGGVRADPLGQICQRQRQQGGGTDQPGPRLPGVSKLEQSRRIPREPHQLGRIAIQRYPKRSSQMNIDHAEFRLALVRYPRADERTDHDRGEGRSQPQPLRPGARVPDRCVRHGRLSRSGARWETMRWRGTRLGPVRASRAGSSCGHCQFNNLSRRSQIERRIRPLFQRKENGSATEQVPTFKRACFTVRFREASIALPTRACRTVPVLRGGLRSPRSSSA